MTRCALLLSLSLSVVTLTATACDEPSSTDASRSSTGPADALAAARISLADAIEIASREAPSGVVVEAEFEGSEGGGGYEVEILAGGEVHEFLLHPADGRVLERGVDPEDLKGAQAAAAAMAGASVTLAQAVELAERATDGTAYEVEVQAPGYVVEVVLAGDAVEILVDWDGKVVAGGDAAGPEVGDEKEDGDEDEHEDEDED